MFRTISFHFPNLDHRGWREELADRIFNRAEEEDTQKRVLDRANDQLHHLLQEDGPYKEWKDLKKAMKGSQWGYSDFLLECSLVEQAALVSFDPRGKGHYIRHRAVAKAKGTYFLINQETEEG